MSRREKTVVAHLDEAVGQNVLQKAANEFFRGQRFRGEFLGVALAVLKGDVAIFHFEQAPVADGNAEDVGCEILEGAFARAHRFAMYHPRFVPGLRWHLCE